MSKNKHMTSVGGQALIEGIMMNGPKGAAMAVRKPDGEIQLDMKDFKHIRDKVPFLGWPVIRGVVNFVESMLIGYKCLMASAEISGQLEEEEKPENMGKIDRWLSEHLNEKVFSALMVVATVLAFGICFLLFFYAPTKLFELLNGILIDKANVDLIRLQPLFEGIIKMMLLVLYMFFVSRTKDIKRVFMYHGAEHKAIFCYENGDELTVENVKKYKRFHPRCGTSFIFVVLIISVFITTILRLIVPESVTGVLWVALKLMVLPLIMGIGYECIRFAGKHENVFTRILTAPGMWMQRITTNEPTDDIIEVGIVALKAVITDNPEDDAL
ncbi:MAG: DUF1385 domain-containing protein [Clostridia bacterium]|nr:DUF1385 domain-containing protein [Clostridia bacterium]MBR6780239.1 DUF1385 domain-containing protein [Clostridia bacterium]